MQDTILANYRKNNTGNYPDLKKYELQSTITYETIKPLIPSKEDVSLDQIKSHTKETMEKIYV